MKYIIVIIYDKMVKTKLYGKNLTKRRCNIRRNLKNMGYRRTKKMIGGMTDEDFESFKTSLNLEIGKYISSKTIKSTALNKDAIRTKLNKFYTELQLNKYENYKNKRYK